MGFDIKGKVALVTGGNRGIGRAIVEQLLASGAAKIYVAVRNPESANDLIENSDGRVVAVKVDLQDNQSIVEAATVASDVELVVNNAGVLKVVDLLSPESFDALDFEFDVNVRGLLRVAQAFAPVLKSNGGGALVQLNSVVSIRSFGDFATYSASKAASYSLTQALREQLQEQGTQVVSVHPGPIATDMGDSAGLTEVAEPPSVVAEAIVTALAEGEFHVFPDSMAQDFWQGYESYARNFVEVNMSEGAAS